MNYTTRADETSHHRAIGEAARDDKTLIGYATLAASSHNTQPWLFKREEDAICILPDLNRRCPAVDPDDHHLYASLGCAAENLLIAGRAAGLSGRCSYDAASSGVRLEFEATAPLRSDLFAAIPERQCSRTGYDGSALSDDELSKLVEAGQGEGVSVMLITDRDRMETIAEFVARGNKTQFDDSEWKRELVTWIRFNSREAASSGDGLYGPVMGSPSVPRWLGRIAMHFGFSADKQNAKDHKHIMSSSAIAVIHSESNDKKHWIEAGRCYQRLALQATALGLRNAFINQPVEVAALRSEFAQFLGLGERRPDLVVRIGRGPEMPRSPRRPVDDVIVRGGDSR
ncbi:Tat pathway signal protein [Wenzhouxiangella sp. XN201]|uniref:Acg family FMN-binding oxidoreductase n=1 Tax=Wenzhouxiangella sp. XN201 TaxID=2710755 RepID=UPI0013CB083B|nr:nitroreductase family protein [Wenzhouxiangella sp. XN201]NEZ03573.1 Tat pathway signal protein [Wenzhouxiangella sp. XN201]